MMVQRNNQVKHGAEEVKTAKFDWRSMDLKAMQADLDAKVNAFTAQYDEVRDAFVQRFGDVAVTVE